MAEVFVNATSYDAMSTLDEPVSTTLLRDARAVGRKLIAVVAPPLSDGAELREWDLWGPLFLCLTLASILAASAKSSQGGLVFSAVFVIVWAGAAVVTLNAKLLGSNVSFFQTVCVMGYCIAPICLAAILALAIPFFLVNLLLTALACGWSCWASLRFFRGTIGADKELLGIYPVGLFYFFMSWMVAVGI